MDYSDMQSIQYVVHTCTEDSVCVEGHFYIQVSAAFGSTYEDPSYGLSATSK